MKRPKLESLSFDDLVALRERITGMIASMAATVKRDLQARIDQLDGLTRRGRGRPPGRPHALLGRKISPKYRNCTLLASWPIAWIDACSSRWEPLSW
jgi:hypothetical protein